MFCPALDLRFRLSEQKPSLSRNAISRNSPTATNRIQKRLASAMSQEEEHNDAVNGTGDEQPEVDDADKKALKKSARHDGGVADLERVTDYAEEKEIDSADVTNAINIFGEKANKESAEKLAKERELQKIHVKKEDIELISNEIMIPRSTAEKVLREHSGDVVAALETLIK